MWFWVVTHSLTYLDVCDQVLLLAPGGKTAFCGPPSQIGPAMGTTNWADIFSSVADDPDAAKARYLARTGPQPPPPPVEEPAELGEPTHTSLFRQFSTIARRQVRLIVSDRGYFIFLALLPFIMGSLSMSVPGDVGFGKPDPLGDAPTEPAQILVLLNVGAVFMGTASPSEDLIGERAIFIREQAVGLSTTAYMLAKVCVYTVFAVVQSAIVTIIAILGKGGPTQGAVALGQPEFELFVDIAATTVASAMLGLLLSSLARSNEQIMPLLVVAVMSQLVFSGGMIPVTARLGLDQMSWATPARWGFASSASTVDLLALQAWVREYAARLALATHGRRVVVRHGDAGLHQRLLSRLRALEDPPQGRLITRLAARVRVCAVTLPISRTTTHARTGVARTATPAAPNTTSPRIPGSRSHPHVDSLHSWYAVCTTVLRRKGPRGNVTRHASSSRGARLVDRPRAQLLRTVVFTVRRVLKGGKPAFSAADRPGLNWLTIG